jgi:hypothetical protein
MVERERQAVDRDPVAALDESRGLLGVFFRIGSAGQPPAVLASFRRPERGVGEDFLLVHLLAAAEGLEDRPARKLVGPVTEHRPMRNLARRRSAGAKREEDAARPFRRQPIEVRRPRGLDAGPPAEGVVRPVGESVEQDDDDRVHARRLMRTAAPKGGRSVRRRQTPGQRRTARTLL